MLGMRVSDMWWLEDKEDIEVNDDGTWDNKDVWDNEDILDCFVYLDPVRYTKGWVLINFIRIFIYICNKGSLQKKKV